MKFLYFTDPHFRLNSPINRIESPEDFKLKVIAKLRRVIEIAEEQSVEAIFCGGDFFDQSTPSYSLFTEIVNVLNDNIIDIFTVWGNHDMINANTHSTYRTALHALNKSRKIKILKYKKYDNLISFTGQSYSLDPFDFQVNNECKFKVLIPHLMITDRPAQFDSYLPHEIKTNADLIMCGHYHQPFDVVTEHCRFVNPGSLMRLSSIKGNFNRYPRVSIIEVKKDKLDVTNIDLKEFKKGDEVFNRISKKDRESNFASFIEYINNFKSEETINLEKTIDIIAKDFSVSKEVIKEVKSRLL